MEPWLAALFAVSAVVAFVVARWWAVLVPLASLGVLYAGLNAGWWGNGVGDGWPIAFALVLGAGILAAVLGLAARSLVRQRGVRRSPSSRG